MNELQKKIYDRFVRYVSVETTSDPESTVTPTTQSQIEFAHLLAKEMKTGKSAWKKQMKNLE